MAGRAVFCPPSSTDCQDNEVSWLDWEAADRDLLAFTRRLIQLRREHPTFRRRRFFQGRPIRGTVDVGWFKPDGTEMDDHNWADDHARSLGLFLNGEGINDVDSRGQVLGDDSFLVLLNAYHQDITWTLPTQWGDRVWTVELATTPTPEPGHGVGAELVVPARSLVVLIDTTPEGDPTA